ncbi:hypothetical protein SDC9_90358 [bioreactor metagenome]|uniref:Spore coat protein U/FanG domain-containing protein n=1 Tax=bioreactor metagenome TaxID=1076179 RepID=A0A644ZUX3_9ZZZZ
MHSIPSTATHTAKRVLFRLALATGAVCLFPPYAQASVSCSAWAEDIVFYDVIPWQSSGSMNGTITVRCQSGLFDIFQQRVNVCLGIGTGTNSSSWEPRRMFLAGNTGVYMGFQIFKPDGSFFGSPFQPEPLQISNLSVPGWAGSQSYSVTMRATLPTQSASLPPGQYTANFTGGHTLMAVSSPVTVFGNPSDCTNSMAASGHFPFTVIANVPAYCSITSTNTMAFEPVAGFGDSARDASTIIGVRCTATTAYKINLTPSNNNANGQGALKLTSGGTDSVAYQLYQDAARTISWGNRPGNNRSGVGTGQIQDIPVYGRVPANLDATPGNYSDSVQVTVTY